MSEEIAGVIDLFELKILKICRVLGLRQRAHHHDSSRGLWGQGTGTKAPLRQLVRPSKYVLLRNPELGQKLGQVYLTWRSSVERGRWGFSCSTMLIQRGNLEVMVWGYVLCAHPFHAHWEEVHLSQSGASVLAVCLCLLASTMPSLKCQP